MYHPVKWLSNNIRHLDPAEYRMLFGICGGKEAMLVLTSGEALYSEQPYGELLRVAVENK